MDQATRRDLTILFAGLLGVSIGYVLRSMYYEEGEDDDVAHLKAITVPSVIGSVGVANRVAGSLPVEEEDVVVHATVAAITGALLVYFAHGLGRFAPKLASLIR